ncbi:TetR/AcrR family transcriptional regulator [Henriciella litoralis]|uniref:TetR/AcrR family transcriptional regulator n=1 Tax=Henriciella litoralis TaxID=568102 RepID=UPI000A04C9CC|nr:TetR/AcrR family transcriptional regulator [Henriciella litoralis]
MHNARLTLEHRLKSTSPSRPSKYNSDSMQERRHRILRVTRKMIAEKGIEELSVRDLCLRAEVAQKTLYNAFGSKDNVIAAAVQEYTDEFNKSVYYKFPASELEGQLERKIKVNSRNTQLRAYTSALMAVYNAPTAPPEVRRTIRAMSDASVMPYIRELQESDALQPNVVIESMVYNVTSHTYSVLTDWCLNEFEDKFLVERICEALLLVVIGSTTGEHRAAAERWLSDLRANSRSWSTFRRLADVEPRELRAAFLQSSQKTDRESQK